MEGAIERRHKLGIDDDTALTSAQSYLALAEHLLPDLVVELAGIADGASVPFLELFRLNCPGARLPSELSAQRQEQAPVAHSPSFGEGGCTSMISRHPGGVVLGHTEDFAPECREDLYVLRMQTGRSTICALNYAHTLVGCAGAVNSDGLMQVIDSLHDRRHRLGVSAYFLARGVLNCVDIGGALEFIKSTRPLDGGFNHLLVQGQQVVNVESGPTGIDIADVTEDTYAHTNHYLSHLSEGGRKPASNSVARLNTARVLLHDCMTVKDMFRTLANRDGYPDSVCRDRTIGAFVADTRQENVYIAWGQPQPDGSTFHEYRPLKCLS